MSKGTVRYATIGRKTLMNEILITIMVGVTVAIVSNIVSHYLALNRERKKAEHDCEEEQQKRELV